MNSPIVWLGRWGRELICQPVSTHSNYKTKS